MLIIDESSFAGKKTIEKSHKKAQELKQQFSLKYGGLITVFAGDYSQLEPVQAKAIYKEKEREIWDDWVHTFFELRTNHRFKKDKRWGNLLYEIRDGGVSNGIADVLNKRVVGSENGPKTNDIPDNAVYATKTNIDRMAINDGIFTKHIEATHSKNPAVDPPTHTICIKASNLKWKLSKTKYVNFNSKSADILYACCGDAHVKSNDGSKMFDPLLKLYIGRPLMLNDNINVPGGQANGSMCEFVNLTLRHGVSLTDLEIININGYYVRCADAEQVETLNLRLKDSDDQIVGIKCNTFSARCRFPLPIYGFVHKYTPRFYRAMKMTTFPVNVANARTIHKLQGRTIENIVISSWDYKGNWVYVALSRVTRLKGLFLRNPINGAKVKGMDPDLRLFMEKMRKKRIEFSCE